MEFIIILSFIILGGAVLIILVKKESRYEVRRDAERKMRDDAEKREYESKRKKEKEESEKSKRIAAELEKLIAAITDDWNASIYADKISTPGKAKVHYQFENGDYIVSEDKKLIYTTLARSGRVSQEITYTIGLIYQHKFRALFNRIVEIVNSGKTASIP